jgi:hypothetical protein
VRAIDELLVAGVGVHGLHEALLDAERVVEHLHDRHEAVRGAARVGDDLLGREVEVLVVDAVHERRVGAVARGRHDDERGATLEVVGGGVALGEDAGRLDDDVDAEVAPRELLRIAHLQHLELVTVDRDAARGGLDGLAERAHHRVVLQQVRHRLERAEVVHRHDVDVDPALLGSAEEVAADATEAVDTNTNRHDGRPFTRGTEKCRLESRDRLYPIVGSGPGFPTGSEVLFSSAFETSHGRSAVSGAGRGGSPGGDDRGPATRPRVPR